MNQEEIKELVLGIIVTQGRITLLESDMAQMHTQVSKKRVEIEKCKESKAGVLEEKEKADLLRQIDRRFENPDAHYQLGQVYQGEGQWAKAEYQYNTALSFDPAYRRAQAAIVKVLKSSGDEAKAAMSADIYISQVSGSAGESLKLALAFQKEGLDEYALTCYRQALRLAPNSAKVNRQMGYYYLSKGDRERAKDYLSRSFALNPNQPEVAGELGRLGVETRIPRKTEQRTGKLDKIVDRSDENYR